jgi:hypothetical protein
VHGEKPVTLRDSCFIQALFSKKFAFLIRRSAFSAFWKSAVSALVSLYGLPLETT